MPVEVELQSQPRLAPRQAGVWRLVDRLQRVLYRNGWPARAARRLGLEPKVRITKYRLVLSGTAGATPPLTVAFASDFHAGITTDSEVLREGCELLRVAGVDLLLLGGDFVSLDDRQIDWLAPLLGLVPAPAGRFAVLGNHDHWNGASHIVERLEAAGIELLTNENRRLAAPFENYWVCGLDDFILGSPDTRAALAGAGGMRIILMHGPANLLSLAGECFEVAFCGHTHGGQIAMPGGTPITTAPGPLSRTYSRGRYRMDHGGTLVVSVGLGCSTFPLRLNSTPEILVCQLVAATPSELSSGAPR